MKNKSLQSFLSLLPVIFSLLLLTAHFMKVDILPLVILLLISPLGLLIKKPLIPRIYQIILILGSLEWIRTLIHYASQRQDKGEPWMRLAIILIVISLLTLASSLVFFTKSQKSRYK